MKTLAIIHTAYIAFASTIVLMLSILGLFRGSTFFQLNFLIRFQVFLQIALTLVGLSTIIVHFCKKSLVGWFQLLWWIPQLIQIGIAKYDPIRHLRAMSPIYDLTMGLHLLTGPGWNLGLNEYLWVKLNLIAIIGIGLSLAIILKRQQPSNQKPSGVDFV